MSLTLLKGGRVVDPANRRDGTFDVLIDGDRIARVGRDLAAPNGVTIIEVPSGLVVSRAVGGVPVYPQHVIAATPLDQTGCICPPGNIIAEDGGLTGDKVGGVYSTSVGGVGFYRSTNGGLTFTNTVPGPASSADTSAAFPVVADNGSGKLAVVWLAVQGSTSSVLFTTSSDFGTPSR